MTKLKNPTITGIAKSNAKRGEPVTIEVDMGVRGTDWVNALPDEPPHVALLRLERENTLMWQVDERQKELSRLRAQVAQLETNLTHARVPNYDRAEFMDELSSRIVSHFFDHLKGLMDRSDYE